MLESVPHCVGLSHPLVSSDIRDKATVFAVRLLARMDETTRLPRDPLIFNEPLE